VTPAVTTRNLKNFVTSHDPLAHKGDWEQRLAKVSKQSQFQH
jgi:hypothetical protein